MVQAASQVAESQEAPAATQNFPPVASPIAGAEQATEATQHARWLILAQGRAAMAVQANTSSQSAQRLLQ